MLYPVGIGASFFTGGASLALLAGELGTIYGVIGTGTSIATKVTYSISMKNCIEKINSVVEQLKDLSARLDSILQEYNSTLTFIKDSFRLNNDEAWFKTNQFYAMSRN